MQLKLFWLLIFLSGMGFCFHIRTGLLGCFRTLVYLVYYWWENWSFQLVWFLTLIKSVCVCSLLKCSWNHPERVLVGPIHWVLYKTFFHRKASKIGCSQGGMWLLGMKKDRRLFSCLLFEMTCHKLSSAWYLFFFFSTCTVFLGIMGI